MTRWWPLMLLALRARRIARRHLSGRVHRLQKRHERARFRRIQIPTVRGHVAAALNHLTNQLIRRQADGDGVERRPALSSVAAERMAVPALLVLKHERTLALEGRASSQVRHGNGGAAPRVHGWAPWRRAAEIRQR